MILKRNIGKPIRASCFIFTMYLLFTGRLRGICLRWTKHKPFPHFMGILKNGKYIHASAVKRNSMNIFYFMANREIIDSSILFPGFYIKIEHINNLERK